MKRIKDFYKNLSPELIKSYWKFVSYCPKPEDLKDPYWQMAVMGLEIHNNYWPVTKENK